MTEETWSFQDCVQIAHQYELTDHDISLISNEVKNIDFQVNETTLTSLPPRWSPAIGPPEILADTRHSDCPSVN